MAFISCLEELEQVSYQEQISLFKRNLDKVEMLAYVVWFNRENVDHELKFILGDKDMEQWQVISFMIVIYRASSAIGQVYPILNIIVCLLV